jgi:hypothetical protein
MGRWTFNLIFTLYLPLRALKEALRVFRGEARADINIALRGRRGKREEGKE